MVYENLLEATRRWPDLLIREYPNSNDFYSPRGILCEAFFYAGTILLSFFGSPFSRSSLNGLPHHQVHRELT